MEQLLKELSELRTKSEQIDFNCLPHKSSHWLAVYRGLAKIEDTISDMVYILKENEPTETEVKTYAEELARMNREYEESV